MLFKDYLATFPMIDHLAGLEVYELDGKCIHYIPAIEGKLGSLKLYNALAEQFDNQLNTQSAQQGLIWFAEYVKDAQDNIGKHPNIDLLLNVVASTQNFRLKPIIK